MTFDPQFKKALQMLPEAEKDKLILRMLRFNKDLANKLRFELVDTDSVLDKREQLQEKIIKNMQSVSKKYYSAGYLMMETREISAQITTHVTITKDKFGEISLNCCMLRHLLELNNERIAAEKHNKAYTLCIYIVARIFKILMLIQKQHEDLHMEFREDIVAIGKFIGNNSNIMKVAIQNGLDVNWLIQFDIPENIADIYKDLRENGLLR